MTTAEMLLRLGAGVGLGALIGLERQYRARMAGLQTNAQVAAGVTLFVLLSAHGFSGATADPTRVAAQIVRDRLSGRRSDSARRPHRERFEHRGHAVLLGGGRGARRSRHVHRSGGRDRHRARCPHDAEAQSRRQPTYFQALANEESEAHVHTVLVDAPSRTEFAPQSVASTRNGTPGQVEVCAALTRHERDDKRTESAVSRLSFEPSVISVRWQVDEPGATEQKG